MASHRLSEKWIKASIAGTIWAASEIVLGSFLHNLRIPFTGNILTAIGLIILISISYIWKERGIFWRAGLICALMKTISPSAVIFGPMIAIFTESLLLEFATRLLGRTIAGFILGSMLAMSWNLIQKILNYIIFYGSNIIEVYSDIIRFAQKQLDIKSDMVWMPVIILLILYALFGLIASITGIKVGNRLTKETDTVATISSEQLPENVRPAKNDTFNYSVIWLFVNVALILISFVLLNMTPWFIWSALITLIVFVWSIRYKKALRQLSKPGFWVLFVVITLLTAFAFTKAGPGENALLKGLLTGVQMNFRAVMMIVGFSVLGTELYNPDVRKFFLRSSFRNLPLALELSAESLPLFITAIPNLKTLVKDPVSVFSKVILNADSRLLEVRHNENQSGKIFLVTGPIRGGKTTFVKGLVSAAIKNNIKPVGILSEAIFNGSYITGYDIVNIESGLRAAFLRSDGQQEESRIGKFNILREGLETGRLLLHKLASENDVLIIIDEVGMLELQNGGWSENLTELLGSGNNLLITVRDIYLSSVIEKWSMKNVMVIDISKDDPETLIRLIS